MLSPLAVRPTLHISKMLPKLEKGRKTLQMKQRVPETYRRTPPRLHPNLQHHSARASWDLSGENLKVCDFGGEINVESIGEVDRIELGTENLFKVMLGVPQYHKIPHPLLHSTPSNSQRSYMNMLSGNPWQPISFGTLSFNNSQLWHLWLACWKAKLEPTSAAHLLKV